MNSTLRYAACCMFVVVQARAHDARAVARYVLDETSPSGMSLELDAVVDDWRFEVVGRPAHPAPGETFELSVLALDARRIPLNALVSLSVFHATGAGERVFGPLARRPASGTYTFGAIFPAPGNHALLLEFADGPVRHSLRFEHAVGQPGAPRSILGFTLAGVVLLLALAGLVRWWREHRGPHPEAGP